MDAKCYLILDQGGSSSRALVISQTGQTLSQATVMVATDTPSADRVEQDPQALVNSLQQAAIQAIASLTPLQVERLKAAALVTQRSSILCWQRDTGAALSPVISWQDRRAYTWLAEQRLDADWLRQHTGLYPSAHYGASKIHWCLTHLPVIRPARADNRLVCGPLASFLVARLTGQSIPLVDPANASRTLLWNINDSEWDEDLLKVFDIPQSILPKLVPTLYDYGQLKVGKVRLPLKLLNGDQSAALFSQGPMQPGTAYINAGTGAFVAALWPGQDFPARLLQSVVYGDDEIMTVVEGTVNGAASALSWAQIHLELADINGLEQWAKDCTEVPLFINAIGGLGSPFWRPDIDSEFEGEGSEQQKMVAVLESIVFLLQSNLVEMHTQGFDLQRIVLTGGLSRLDSFCQKLADISDARVWRPEEVEASARGAAYLLSGAINTLSDHPKSANWQPLAGQEFIPGSPGQAVISQRFDCWREALQVRLAASQ